MLAYIFIPHIQKELDDFRETVWNFHRVRKNKNKLLPDGIPQHIYEFPDKQDPPGEHMGIPITDAMLGNAAALSGFLDEDIDFVTKDFRERCEAIIPDPSSIEVGDLEDAFSYLRDRVTATDEH